MKDRLAIGDDGAIQGLFVIGYHGTVRRDRTPALKEPVHVDQDRFLTRVVAHEPESRSVLVERSRIRIGDMLPEDATVLRELVAAQLGWGFLVMGDAERRSAPRIAAAMRSSDPEDARAAARALLGDPLPDWMPCYESDSGLLQWYCSFRSASALRDRIRSVAMESVEHAARARDLDELEGCAWWLQRTGVDEREFLYAAAGLKEARSPHWFPVARALLRGRDRAWLEKEVEAIRLALVGARSDDGASSTPTHRPTDPWMRGIWELRSVLGLSGWAWTPTDSALIAESRDRRRRVLFARDPTLGRLRPCPRTRPAGNWQADDLEVKCPDEIPWDALFDLLQTWLQTGAAEVLEPSAYRRDDIGEQAAPQRMQSIVDVLPGSLLPLVA